ncbi:MAG: cell division protein FtsI, partial [Chloroflexi bacterium]|nr:cell division protein FtsI [Chloroflexota bacterium]
GTAEVAAAKPHAWFAGFAPASDPRVLVVAVVENGGTGGSVAAPIVRQVIAAALGL